MKFREFLMTKQNITERVYGKLANESPVYINPTNTELKVCGVNIRGIIGDEGEVYIWKESSGLHIDVATQMNIPWPYIPITISLANGIYNVSISTYKNRVREQDFEALRNNSLLLRMFGRNKYYIPTYEEWEKSKSIF